MRLTAVSRAAGLTLARDIPAADPRQMPILRAGATLTPRYQQALTDLGVHAIWVQDRLSEGIEPQEIMSPTARQQAAQRVTGALDDARKSLEARRPISPEAASELQSIVEQIASSIASRPDVALVLTDLASADAYTHQHSIDVTALGLLIGRTLFQRRGWQDFRGAPRFDDIDGRLLRLGMGLLLHDVGKMAVPQAIIQKPGKLTDEEREIMQTHPEAGAALLDAESISPLVRAVVREHHERWDGSGYPRGLKETQINELARIAAVADVYDAITSERPYKPAAAAFVGVGIIVDGSGSAFDPEIVQIFEELVPPFPVGSEVRLPDGTVGVVAQLDAATRRPTIRLAEGDSFREVEVDSPGDLLAA
jgi:HD-GYP domain-containing protein (c-di-GMP phosphodiesterase class II)